MADDEYEIVPIKELHTIKEQLKELRSAISPEEYQRSEISTKNVPIYSESSKDMLEAMEKLTSAIKDLTNLFSSGKSEIEFSGETHTQQKTSQSSIKMDTLIDQNKAIAKGILLLVNLLSGKENESQTSSFQQNLSNQRQNVQQPEFRNLNQNLPKQTYNAAQQQNQQTYPYEINNGPQYQQPKMPEFLKKNNDIKNNNMNNNNNFSVPPAPKFNNNQKEPNQKKSIFGFR